MSINEQTKAEKKEEERLLLLGESYEKKLKEYQSMEEDSYLTIRDRMRFRLNVFVFLCFTNLFIMCISLVLYFQPPIIHLSTTSYSSHNEEMTFILKKDFENGHRILFSENAETGEQLILEVTKRDLRKLEIN